MSEFTHLNEGFPSMVDVGEKSITKRTAVARGSITLPKEVLSRLENQEIHVAKGPVFQTAILAGTLAAKKTSDLIPLCHPLALNRIQIKISTAEDRAIAEATVSCDGKTGVEMEALTAVSVALLTIYDMCKSFSQDMRMGDIELIRKEGGKSDYQAHG
ncbi:MAG: cyclic pyranopterin monophosphate synthase MoaC [Flavobacteriales bacterium]